jgi:hypothetical protein
MSSLFQKKSVRVTSCAVVACFLAMQTVGLFPRTALAASAADDLKKIEYKYYFRGDYAKTITELRAFLQRSDIGKSEMVEAREYLAASLILNGALAEGKSEFMEILKSDPTYAGPAPDVFKSEIVTAFGEAKAEYASIVIRTVPKAASGASTTAAQTGTGEGKPIYKKWWFYAGMGALLLVVAGAASGGGDDAAPPRDTGTVTVEVDVP